MLGWIRRKLENKRQGAKDVPILHISRVFSHEDYQNHASKDHTDDLARFAFERSLIPQTQTEFKYHGYCYVCKKPVNFLVDFNYSYEVDGVLMPNWRERLVCPSCHLNNRMRATVHIFEQELKPDYDSIIYVTEQTTRLYKWFRETFTHVLGSEYLGDSVGYGRHDRRGIRNEDLTRLSFANNEFDYILSFDVFEHIPKHQKALMECYRCLKPGGILYFSVPFIKTSEKNIIRACVSENGEIEHLLPPEYHGDPLRSDGCLCFHHFGWELLDEINSIGFERANALLYWSQDLGYLGGEQVMFTATKPLEEKRI